MVQLTHHVSAAAANSFWKLGVHKLHPLLAQKEDSGITKNVPGFIHLRRQLHEDQCPEIHMKFVYMNRETKAIETVHGSKAPIKQFPKSKFIKLYEEAHIKVKYIFQL